MYSAGQYLRLETRGRRSGKPHSVILRYVTYGDGIFVFPESGGRQDWVANILVEPRAKVYAEGRAIDGQVTQKRANGPNEPVLLAFARKYGIGEVRKKYGGMFRYFQIQSFSESPADYYELVYADLEAAFDGVAPEYDQHIFGNPINTWLRNRSVSLMTKLFRPGQTLVEVGCGTGTETLALARRGIRVLASDLSSKMLQVLKKKAAKQGLEEYVVPIHCRPYMLKEEVRKLGYEKVDGAYSTYGAINTDPRLESLFANLHDIVKQDGKLVLGVWNRYCLFEISGYSLRFKPSMAVARFRNPVPVGKSRFCVSTNAYTVGTVNRLASRFFKLLSVRGVGILLPPSNLTQYIPPRRLLGAVKKIEVSIEGSFPWNMLGDHFLAVYARVG